MCSGPKKNHNSKSEKEIFLVFFIIYSPQKCHGSRHFADAMLHNVNVKCDVGFDRGHGS